MCAQYRVYSAQSVNTVHETRDLCTYVHPCVRTAASKSSGERLVFMVERVGRHALLPPAAPSLSSSLL